MPDMSAMRQSMQMVRGWCNAVLFIYIQCFFSRLLNPVAKIFVDYLWECCCLQNMHSPIGRYPCQVSGSLNVIKCNDFGKINALHPA